VARHAPEPHRRRRIAAGTDEIMLEVMRRSYEM
jgi:hypothetical protein